MRISDWSSDVCSSDLGDHQPQPRGAGVDAREIGRAAQRRDEGGAARSRGGRDLLAHGLILAAGGLEIEAEDREPEHAVIEQEIDRSEEHTSELQSLMRNSYAVFCLKKKKTKKTQHNKNMNKQIKQI